MVFVEENYLNIDILLILFKMLETTQILIFQKVENFSDVIKNQKKLKNLKKL